MSYVKIALLMGCLMGVFNCSRSIRKQTFKLPVLYGPTQIHQLTGGPDREGDSELSTFADQVRFDHMGQSIEAPAYYALTQGSTGEAFAGVFTVHATLREGSNGGPPGSGWDQFVVAHEPQFVRKLLPPQAPSGVRAIVPGQTVVRMIAEGEMAKVDDRYWIELPANGAVKMNFWPDHLRWDFGLTLTKDGVAMARQPAEYEIRFKTAGAGVYEIRVRGKTAPKEPDRYSFVLMWGDSSSSGRLKAWDYVWRNVTAGKGE